MAGLLERKTTHFVLWRPRETAPPPVLVIGTFQPANPPVLAGEQRFELQPSPLGSDLWEVAAADCGLQDGQVYHYWFEVQDTSVYRTQHGRMLCTDPTATTTDWRLKSPQPTGPYGPEDCHPASVICYADGRLQVCDPGGETIDWSGDPAPATLPPNQRLVIYELPTAWTRAGSESDWTVGVGTFRDVMALLDAGHAGANFSTVAALQLGHAHLKELGVNALELLPPADSFVKREWGYATSNYFAPDFDLGFPEGDSWPTANSDLVSLIRLCHQQGIRFFVDMVMAFANRYSYRNINFLDFHINYHSQDAELFAGGQKRDPFGGDLFKYNFQTQAYDPVTDSQGGQLVPARRLMLCYLTHWMDTFRVDGLRLDSVNNIANWDFLQEFTEHARDLWRRRWSEAGQPMHGADERFLVVGEELSVPLDLVRQKRLEGLWNEKFKHRLRYAVLGQNDPEDASFEATVRNLIDCRNAGFGDLAQAVNYVTSHDVEGMRNERLFNFLSNNGIVETEPRIKLAFVCLLTAVGIPMILAGEEFADQHDKDLHSGKQVDSVNFERREEHWRLRIFQYVCRLVRLRTTYAALAVNDTRFIHQDFTEGRRVLAWQRGIEGSGELVVVVANFSDWGTPDRDGAHAEYVVPNWPSTPAGKRWREVSQDREVPSEWIGREPLFPWEAKVYALV